MPEIKRLDDTLSVAGQLQPSDFEALAEAGFATVINNRPDGEEPGQPTAEQGEEAADAAGLAYAHLPTTAQSMGPETVVEFGALLEEAPTPILAHCRSGARSTLLWALYHAHKGDLTVDSIVDTAQDAGYDLSQARPLIEQMASMRG